MATYDRIPDILPNKQFPIGDICDSHKQAKADAWIGGIAKQSLGQFVSMLNLSSRIHPTIITDKSAKTHNEALALCKAWDRVENIDGTKDYFRFSSVGYRLMLAFNKETQYLPFYNMDFSQELSQMRLPEENLYRAREYAYAAWSCMQQYGNVHRTLTELLEEAGKKVDLVPDDHRQLFQAGMALPFNLGLTARLIGYTKPFSSFNSRDGSGNLMNIATTDFNTFFI